MSDKPSTIVVDLSEFDQTRFFHIKVGVFRFSIQGDFQAFNSEGEGEKIGRLFGEKLAAALLPEWSRMEDMNEQATLLGADAIAKGTADPPGQAIEAILTAHRALTERDVAAREAVGFIRGARLRFCEDIRARNSLETAELDRVGHALAEAEAKAGELQG